MGAVKKPKPFKRASIDLTPVTRKWVQTHAQNLSLGDIVTDWGELTFKEELSGAVRLVFFSGGVLILGNENIVRAFTEGECVGNSQ